MAAASFACMTRRLNLPQMVPLMSLARLPFWPDDRDQIVQKIASRPGYLKIVLKIRDELHFLREWMKHHASIVGYENIIIFDNKSADPELFDFYDTLPEDVVIAAYGLLHNMIHNTNEFPELYATLARSCEYFMFLDCDEFLVHVSRDDIVRRDEIVDILKDAAPSGVTPGVWLDNGVRSRTIYRCDSSHYLGQMAYSGKPLVRSKADFNGWVLHNITIDRSLIDNSVPPEFFVQHRLNLFPERRIKANLVKMVAECLIPEGWSVDQALAHDFSAIRDAGVHRYLADIRRLRQVSGTSALMPGTMQMEVGREVDFFSQQERDIFHEFRYSTTVNFVDRYLGISAALAARSAAVESAPAQADLASSQHPVAYGGGTEGAFMSTAARNDIVKMLWRGNDPFLGFPRGLYKPDPQGWNHAHPYFAEAIDQFRPRVIVEVGVWKGASSIAMAKRLKDRGQDSVVISVDTWLGSVEHWTDPTWFESLVIEHGQPMLMRTFMTNVLAAGVEDVIVPLPLDSLGAAETLRRYGIQIDVLHIDAGHEYDSVISDLKVWWPILRSGGLLIGDDYYPEGPWPGLRRAFEEFFGPMGHSFPLENRDAKCRVVKP